MRSPPSHTVVWTWRRLPRTHQLSSTLQLPGDESDKITHPKFLGLYSLAFGTLSGAPMALLRAAVLLASAGAGHAAIAIATTTMTLSKAPNTWGAPATSVYSGINLGAERRGRGTCCQAAARRFPRAFVHRTGPLRRLTLSSGHRNDNDTTWIAFMESSGVNGACSHESTSSAVSGVGFPPVAVFPGPHSV